MAITFYLTDGTTTINFVEGPPIDDFTLRANLGEGWMPKVAIPTGDGSIPDYLTEVIPILIECTSDDDFAATMQEFHSLQKRAAEYWIDPQQATPVWWHVQTVNETWSRRVLVKSLGLEFDLDFGGLYNDCPSLTEGRAARVVIVRHPYWERPTAIGAVTDTNISVLNGTFDYSGTDVVGDVPARIDNLKLLTDNADNITRAWISFRSADKHGTVTNFVPLWEMEDGGMPGLSITDPDATASGAKSVAIALTGAWALKNWWTLSLISANESDNYGTFLLLISAKVDAATEALMRVDHGIQNQDTWQEGEPVAVTANAWTWHNMGVFTIPLRNLQAIPTSLVTADCEATETFRIMAIRTSGAGDMDMDCMAVIPLDEYFLYVDHFHFDNTSGMTGIVCVSPHDRHDSISYDDNTNDNIDGRSAVAVTGGGVPIGDGRMFVVLGEDNTVPTITATYDPSIQIVTRWITLRGAE